MFCWNSIFYTRETQQPSGASVKIRATKNNKVQQDGATPRCLVHPKGPFRRALLVGQRWQTHSMQDLLRDLSGRVSCNSFTPDECSARRKKITNNVSIRTQICCVFSHQSLKHPTNISFTPRCVAETRYSSLYTALTSHVARKQRLVTVLR